MCVCVCVLVKTHEWNAQFVLYDSIRSITVGISHSAEMHNTGWSCTPANSTPHNDHHFPSQILGVTGEQYKRILIRAL